MAAKGTRKLYKQFWESYYPFILGGFCVVVFFLLKKYIGADDIIDRLYQDQTMSLVITIESILVGFVLTILAFIIQMNNKALDLIKELNMYDRLINFGKAAIYSGLLVVIISFVIFILYPADKYEWLQYAWIGACSWSSLSIYRFVKIFFVVAKSA